MLGKLIVPAALGVAAMAAVAPAAASAQSFGVYVSSGYPAYDRYDNRGYAYRRGDDDRRDAWLAHERWEHERQEYEEARRRYWARQQWEQQRHWHHDEEDDD